MNEILKKRVEEAAEEYVMGNSASYVECFEAGARWRINAVWHCANEIPKGGKNYMIVYSFGNSYDLIDIRYDYDRFCKEDWVDYVSSKGIKRWAYISDLLPDSGREAGAL